MWTWCLYDVITWFMWSASHTQPEVMVNGGPRLVSTSITLCNTSDQRSRLGFISYVAQLTDLHMKCSLGSDYIDVDAKINCGDRSILAWFICTTWTSQMKHVLFFLLTYEWKNSVSTCFPILNHTPFTDNAKLRSNTVQASLPSRPSLSTVIIPY